MTKTEALDRLKAILAGIDQNEMDSDVGWWETTSGSEFGARRLAEVESLILSL